MFDISKSLFILPQDKANHIFYGAVFTGIVFSIAHFIPGWCCLNAWNIATIACFFLGWMKELSDAIVNKKTTGDYMKGPHGVEMMDSVATWIGGAIVLLPLWISTLKL